MIFFYRAAMIPLQAIDMLTYRYCVNIRSTGIPVNRSNAQNALAGLKRLP